MRRTVVVRVLMVALVILTVPAASVGAQSWEVAVGGVGVGAAAALRVLPSGSGLRVEALWSGAWQTREGSVCHGLVGPTGCPNEPVTYSGGVLFLSAGWLLPIPLGDALGLRVVPTVGVGALRASESGVFTGRSASELQPAVRFGAGLEVAWAVRTAWYVLVGASRHEAVARTPDCADCEQLVGGRSSQTQLMVGFGVRR